jgi:hypothetical protein
MHPGSFYSLLFDWLRGLRRHGIYSVVFTVFTVFFMTAVVDAVLIKGI